MPNKPTIVDAPNLVVPACLVIEKKGYSIRCEKGSDSEDKWHAENDIVHLVADDVISLLALVSVFGERGFNWKASDEEIDSYLDKYTKPRGG